MKRRVFFGGALAGMSLTGVRKRAVVGLGVQTGPALEYWKKKA